MTEELNGGCLDEREAFEATFKHLSFARKRGAWGEEIYAAQPVQDLWEGFQAGRASLSTSKQAGAEPVAIINGEAATALSLLDALIDIYDDTENKAPEHRCYVEGAWEECLSEARAFLAAPGAAIAAREQEACGEEAFRLKKLAGQMVAPVGRGYAEGWKAGYDAAIASRKEAPPTPAAAIPAAPSGVTDAMVDAYLKANDAYWVRTDELPRSGVKWRNGTPREATREGLTAALTQPTTVQQADVTDEQIIAEAYRHLVTWDQDTIRFAHAVLALKTAQTTALPGGNGEGE